MMLISLRNQYTNLFLKNQMPERILMRDKGGMENGTVESDEKERAWRPWLDPARRKVGVTVEMPRYGICSAPGGLFPAFPGIFLLFFRYAVY
ncbi:MAG TPA: hypothetical protein DE060_12355 [Lentisphaeria bacterium]|nr:hypothetical protein [Lentisphaeria bacterium]HCG49981.1 hypothetical protein [Lentisphaeria bacterium]